MRSSRYVLEVPPALPTSTHVSHKVTGEMGDGGGGDCLPRERSATLSHRGEGGLKQLIQLFNVTAKILKLGSKYVQSVAQNTVKICLQ